MVKSATSSAVFGLLSMALGAASLLGQVTPPPPPSADSAVVAPADYCAASAIYTALAGAGYRRLWTTPIRVPVADLGRLGGGGLTPLRLGGGMTTQTLHLQGADGRRYVFRSVQKVTRQALAEEFWGTPVEDIMRDQLCSFHPSGAVITDRLLEAVGVLHPSPRYVVVPDDPRLEEFREQFAGMLVLFEERPDDGPDGTAGFGGSRQIASTEDLFEDLEEHPDDLVHAQELLKSRLVDLLVGDRDRSINNHLWARYDREDGGHVWRPVPRDRDQAFVRFDGALKTLGRAYDPRLVSFAEGFSDVGGLTRNAWDMDRNLLVSLDRTTWLSVVEEVRDAITDEVIEEAVARMPREHFHLVGQGLIQGLKQRRDHLAGAAEDFYGIVFEEADVHATDEDELAVLTRLEGGGVTLTLGPPEEDAWERGDFFYQRTFSSSETKEIRVYMHGGNDHIRVQGASDAAITLRIVGGGGDDQVLLSEGGHGVVVYDSGSDTRISGEGAKFEERDASWRYSWWADGEEKPDFGRRVWPELSGGYDGDRGLVLAAGFKRDRYGFLLDPYRSRLQLSGGWAVGRSEPIINYRHIFRRLLWGGDFQLQGRYSGFEVVRFYGLGNETSESEPSDYYKVFQKQLVLGASLSFGNGETREVKVGPVFRRTVSDTTNPMNFVTESQFYGTGSFQQAGLQISFDLDERDLSKAPSKGYHLSGGAAFYPAALDVESAFGEIHGELATYISPASGNPTLAARAGGKRVLGTFPYSDAAFLGGSGNLRGLREQRYAGNAYLFGSAELRVFLTRFFLLFPMDFGVFGLTDAGRVFQDDQPTGKWHTSAGGGVWLAPVTRSSTVQASMAWSGGQRAIYLGMGFPF